MNSPEDLYLELLKKTLTFTLWPEPPVPVETFDYLRSPLKRFLVSCICRILRSKQYLLVQPVPPADKSDREDGKVWPVYADTMIGIKRLNNLQFCIETALKEGIEGDFIETGVWKGGGCIFMRGVLAARGVKDRKVYAADSFEGLPRPDPISYPADAGDQHHVHKYLAVSQKDVENNFLRFGLLDDQVVFLKGWFKDTLPNAPISKLAVLRLDGDMYGSTMEALTSLYPKLSTGGFCIIDDYALPGCRKAVDDYRALHNIDSVIHEVDWTGRYWRKES